LLAHVEKGNITCCVVVKEAIKVLEVVTAKGGKLNQTTLKKKLLLAKYIAW